MFRLDACVPGPRGFRSPFDARLFISPWGSHPCRQPRNFTTLSPCGTATEIATPVSPYTFSSDTPYYPTLEDQRHTLNVFAMYRLRPSLNLSGKFLYGSGFPVPSGTYIQLSSGQYVPVGLNETRLRPYARLDVRADKDWAFRRWKVTLYGEILNLSNHYNARFFYSSGINPTTGQAQVNTLQGLPITPTAGLVFQF